MDPHGKNLEREETAEEIKSTVEFIRKSVDELNDEIAGLVNDEEFFFKSIQVLVRRKNEQPGDALIDLKDHYDKLITSICCSFELEGDRANYSEGIFTEEERAKLKDLDKFKQGLEEFLETEISVEVIEKTVVAVSMITLLSETIGPIDRDIASSRDLYDTYIGEIGLPQELIDKLYQGFMEQIAGALKRFDDFDQALSFVDKLDFPEMKRTLLTNFNWILSDSAVLLNPENISKYLRLMEANGIEVGQINAVSVCCNRLASDNKLIPLFLEYADTYPPNTMAVIWEAIERCANYDNCGYYLNNLEVLKLVGEKGQYSEKFLPILRRGINLIDSYSLHNDHALSFLRLSNELCPELHNEAEIQLAEKILRPAVKALADEDLFSFSGDYQMADLNRIAPFFDSGMILNVIDQELDKIPLGRKKIMTLEALAKIGFDQQVLNHLKGQLDESISTELMRRLKLDKTASPELLEQWTNRPELYQTAYFLCSQCKVTLLANEIEQIAKLNENGFDKDSEAAQKIKLLFAHGWGEKSLIAITLAYPVIDKRIALTDEFTKEFKALAGKFNNFDDELRSASDNSDKMALFIDQITRWCEHPELIALVPSRSDFKLDQFPVYEELQGRAVEVVGDKLFPIFRAVPDIDRNPQSLLKLMAGMEEIKAKDPERFKQALQSLAFFEEKIKFNLSDDPQVMIDQLDQWSLAKDKIERFVSTCGNKEIKLFSSDNLWSIIEKAESPEVISYMDFVDEHQDDKVFYCNPKFVTFLLKQPQKAISLLPNLKVPKDSVQFYLVLNALDKVADIEPEKLDNYLSIALRIANSPSVEVKRLASELMDAILEAEDPNAAYSEIEKVFTRNNLPTVGKIFKVFEILYPESKYENMNNYSPVLNKIKNKRPTHRYLEAKILLFRDLLNINILSDNNSLRGFLEIMIDGEEVLSRLDRGETLESNDNGEAILFLNKLDTVFRSAQMGLNALTRAQKNGKELPQLDTSDPLASYRELRLALGAKEGQATTDRLSEIFLRPLGYQTFAEALDAMKTSRVAADARRREVVGSVPEGKMALSAGDLLKGVELGFIGNILQNGSTSAEFLGGSSSSNATPFDIDLDMISEEAAQFGFQRVLETSVSRGYGNITLVFKNRGQFQEQGIGQSLPYDRNKYELFRTQVLSPTHAGIRTGMPSSEIDFIISKLEPDETRRQQELFFQIALNGSYIPVTDSVGEVIFTPGMFDYYRKVFDGLDYYDGSPFRYDETGPIEELDSTQRELAEQAEQISIINDDISQIMEKVLSENGIELNKGSDTSLDHADIYNTGSTGRGTFIPGQSDFDFMIKMPPEMLDKFGLTVSERLAKELKIENSNGRDVLGGRMLKYPDSEFTIDIIFSPKSEYIELPSHDAVELKLQHIEQKLGPEIAKRVIANIVLAKKILSQAGAYKKKDGYLGGLGVENWILANNGNIREACLTFWEAAHNEDRIIPLNEFISVYPIFDPGSNTREGAHDNFTAKLSETGYKRMLSIVESFLNK